MYRDLCRGWMYAIFSQDQCGVSLLKRRCVILYFRLAMNMALLNEVTAFVVEYWGEPKSGLSAETSINDDLGMDGDDGLEFMEAFSRRFAVDLAAFPYDNYFGVEASATPISLIASALRRLTTGKWTTLSPLTVRQLAEAAENGRWEPSV